MTRLAYVITCEHATATIPNQYRHYFLHHLDVQTSHEAVDFGAYDVALSLANRLNAPFFYGEVSRLLVDLNRSLHHPKCFSSFLKHASSELKSTLCDDYYFPYREKVRLLIDRLIKQNGRVIHLSIHTFTPIWHGIVRQGDICLLYGTKREREKRFCADLIHYLKKNNPEFIYRKNYPYRGDADGLTKTLRACWDDGEYIGVEIEMNQRLYEEKRLLEISDYLLKALNELKNTKV
jgi:predicted N-formylglutamate amidohydrolase